MAAPLTSTSERRFNTFSNPSGRDRMGVHLARAAGASSFPQKLMTRSSPGGDIRGKMKLRGGARAG